jgi:hypothetical protein
MRFEERELPSRAVPASPGQLKEGSVYFSVNFIDREMLIPTMEAWVYVGRNLEPEDQGQLYFQDIESYRRGVSYQTAKEGDYVQFLLESEDSLYLFEFERALEELMRCLLRRREKEGVLIPILRAQGFQNSEELPPNSLDESKTYSLRFDDIDLQERFVVALRKAGLAFDLCDDGTITCTADDWPAVNTVASKIRDSCFPWYFSWWKDPESAHLFWEEMKSSGLPFQIEHHSDRLVFLLPKGSEDLHEVISGRVQMKQAGSTTNR